MSTTMRGRGQRLALWFCVWAGLAAAGGAPPAWGGGPVPDKWIVYGREIGHELQGRLANEHDAAVARLHAFLDSPAPHDHPSLVEGLIVRVWITPDARISRTTFKTLGNKQADADLRHILTERPLPAPPPPDMRQPMVLRLRLQPSQPETPT